MGMQNPQTNFHHLSPSSLFDITLHLSNGTERKAHKILLAASSEYFKTMFTSKFKEASDQILPIFFDEHLIPAFDDCLFFIYNGKWQPKERNLSYLLEIANYFRLYCKSLIAGETALRIINQGGIALTYLQDLEKFGYQKELELVLQCLGCNLLYYSEKDSFLRLPIDLFRSVIRERPSRSKIEVLCWQLISNYCLIHHETLSSSELKQFLGEINWKLLPGSNWKAVMSVLPIETANSLNEQKKLLRECKLAFLDTLAVKVSVVSSSATHLTSGSDAINPKTIRIPKKKLMFGFSVGESDASAVRIVEERATVLSRKDDGPVLVYLADAPLPPGLHLWRLRINKLDEVKNVACGVCSVDDRSERYLQTSNGYRITQGKSFYNGSYFTTGDVIDLFFDTINQRIQFCINSKASEREAVSIESGSSRFVPILVLDGSEASISIEDCPRAAVKNLFHNWSAFAKTHEIFLHQAP